MPPAHAPRVGNGGVTDRQGKMLRWRFRTYQHYVLVSLAVWEKFPASRSLWWCFRMQSTKQVFWIYHSFEDSHRAKHGTNKKPATRCFHVHKKTRMKLQQEKNIFFFYFPFERVWKSFFSLHDMQLYTTCWQSEIRFVTRTKIIMATRRKWSALPIEGMIPRLVFTTCH